MVSVVFMTPPTLMATRVSLNTSPERVGAALAESRPLDHANELRSQLRTSPPSAQAREALLGFACLNDHFRRPQLRRAFCRQACRESQMLQLQAAHSRRRLDVPSGRPSSRNSCAPGGAI